MPKGAPADITDGASKWTKFPSRTPGAPFEIGERCSDNTDGLMQRLKAAVGHTRVTIISMIVLQISHKIAVVRLTRVEDIVVVCCCGQILTTQFASDVR